MKNATLPQSTEVDYLGYLVSAAIVGAGSLGVSGLGRSRWSLQWWPRDWGVLQMLRTTTLVRNGG